MWCPNIKKMKAHKAYILWSLLFLSCIPYEKDLHDNKNDEFLAQFMFIPHLAARYQFEKYHRTLTGMAANKTYDFLEKMRYRFWRCCDKPFSIKVCKWNQKVK